MPISSLCRNDLAVGFGTVPSAKIAKLDNISWVAE
jgi:hypothetical protein